MKKLYSFFIFIILISFLVASCSKKEDNPAAPEEKAPGMPSVTFEGPNTNSSDQYALMTKSSVAAFNFFPQMLSSAFSAATPKNSNGDWQWVVSSGTGGSETMTATKKSDGSYYWALIFNGNLSNKIYNNFKALEGTTSADGKSGSWKVFEDNSSTVAGEFTWSTNSSGVLTGTLLDYGSNGTVSQKVELTNKADKSGELRMYDDNNVLTFRSAWNADGTGTWHVYENGVEKTNGNWQ